MSEEYKKVAVRIPLEEVMGASGLGFARLKKYVDQFKEKVESLNLADQGQYEAVVVVTKDGEEVDRSAFTTF